jgi:hypothetical protein
MLTCQNHDIGHDTRITSWKEQKKKPRSTLINLANPRLGS